VIMTARHHRSGSAGSIPRRAIEFPR
jgi:hypothetical protein